MKKMEIKKIADKLGWEINETRNAIQELSQCNSIVNCELFALICADAKSIEQRWVKVLEYLLDELKLDLVSLISKLLDNTDPCFNVLATFNLNEVSSNRKPKILYELHGGKKSFLITDYIHPLDHPMNSYKSLHLNPKFDATELCYEFLDSLLIYKVREKGVNILSIMVQVVKNVGLLALEIKAFRNLSSFYSFDPTQQNGIKQLIKAIESPLVHRKYWFYFVMVEKMKVTYGLRGAFREVSRKINELIQDESNYVSEKTIFRRYFEMKKIAKKVFKNQKEAIDNQFDLEAIVEQYYIRRAVNKHFSVFMGSTRNEKINNFLEELCK